MKIFVRTLHVYRLTAGLGLLGPQRVLLSRSIRHPSRHCIDSKRLRAFMDQFTSEMFFGVEASDQRSGLARW